MAARPEASGKVQGVHGLGFDFTEDGLTHRLELPVHLGLAHLQQEGTGDGATRLGVVARSRGSERAASLRELSLQQS